MIFVGDWSPRNRYGDILLKESIILANLEGPVLERDHNLLPLPKAGPNIFSLYLPSKKQQLVFSLANNHIMDYGYSGLETTQSLLNNKGFKMAGAGKDIIEARRPTVVEDNGVFIGIISCCEVQFGLARENKAGVAEIGPWVYSAIGSLKQEVDVVVISVHAAVEDSPWPSPSIQELYRSFIDAGATVVHGHHAHVPQSVEEYKDGLILYGLGNFLVNPDQWRNIPNTLWSIGAEIDFCARPISWRLLIFEIEEAEDKRVYVRESSETERKNHEQYIKNCNLPLKNPTLLAGLWQETCLRTYFHYKAKYIDLPNNQFIKLNKRERIAYLKDGFKKITNGLTGTEKKVYSSKVNYLLWYVMFACQSHRDSLATSLGILSGELDDLRTDETRRLADEMMSWSIGVVPL